MNRKNKNDKLYIYNIIVYLNNKRHNFVILLF